MKKIEKYENWIVNVVKLGYALGCCVLYLCALLILFSSVYTGFIEIISPSFSIYKILDEIALIIFSIAALDVAKYLAIEEFIKRSHKASLYEEKQSLSKFVVIISTAIALEGLVLAIETSKTNLYELIYPVFFLITSALFILVLGIYKKLTKHEDKLSKDCD
jgi:hypothetical protein